MRSFIIGLDLSVLILLILYWEWRDNWYMDRVYRLRPGVRVDGRAGAGASEPSLTGP